MDSLFRFYFVKFIIGFLCQVDCRVGWQPDTGIIRPSLSVPGAYGFGSNLSVFPGILIRICPRVFRIE